MAKQKKPPTPKRVSFLNLNLKPEEEDNLKELLERKDIKGKQLVRALVRQWMAEGGEGVLKYSRK